jgi:hypothetical protein
VAGGPNRQSHTRAKGVVPSGRDSMRINVVIFTRKKSVRCELKFSENEGNPAPRIATLRRRLAVMAVVSC